VPKDPVPARVAPISHTLQVPDRSVTIRSANASDRAALVDICLRTGDAGADATGLVANGGLYGEIYAVPYLVLEPELAVVAELDGTVCGYVLGALHTPAFEGRCQAEWWPALRHRHPLPGEGTDVDRRLIALVHTGFHTPTALTDRYPSHLHINLLPELQGHGVGRRLMDALIERLVAAGSHGVHLGVDPRNAHAIGFYEHLGFRRHEVDEGMLFTRSLP
jgi:ribosomal protein S18 acetylase RimI-like enzyme